MGKNFYMKRNVLSLFLKEKLEIIYVSIDRPLFKIKYNPSKDSSYNLLSYYYVLDILKFLFRHCVVCVSHSIMSNSLQLHGL